MPRIERIAAALGEDVEVLAPPIPHDCVDGFIEGERTGPTRGRENVSERPSLAICAGDPSTSGRCA
jgi:hypothetical protein